mgnify:FL=1
MANTMTGRILSIGDVESIQGKSGNTFNKRTLVLNCTYSNYGEVYENYPSFEFSGRHIDDLSDFKVGDVVTVSFVIQGNKYKKENQPEKFFNTIAGYKVEHLYRDGAPKSSSQKESQTTTAAEQKVDDLPF